MKFPVSHKTRYNDVILQAHNNGIVLKSAAFSGTIMTRCMIKKDFFHNGNYHIEVRNEADRKRLEEEQQPSGMGKPLIEFCLPFSELKQLIEGIVEEENIIQLLYPELDNYLQINIPEESKGMADKIKQTTILNLETYEVQHTLNAEFQFNNSNIQAQIFGKVQHFKKALKEFSFLADNEPIEVRFSQAYPHIQLKYGNESQGRYHVVKFNAEIDDLVCKKLTETAAWYTVESLRLAFGRISRDNLLCIVCLNSDGFLSVKHM